MTEHITGLTQLVNHYLGSFALGLLSWLHVAPENPETPIPEHVVMGVMVLILGTLLVVFVISRWRKPAREPVAGARNAAAIPPELLERARARAARETED